MKGPATMCGVLLMDERSFPARCHRDEGHTGLHRAFTVGGTQPGYWQTGDTETHELSWWVSELLAGASELLAGALPSEEAMDQAAREAEQEGPEMAAGLQPDSSVGRCNRCGDPHVCPN